MLITGTQVHINKCRGRTSLYKYPEQDEFLPNLFLNYQPDTKRFFHH